MDNNPKKKQKILRPVYLAGKGTRFVKFLDVASCIMARDYKGFGDQEMTGVIECTTD